MILNENYIKIYLCYIKLDRAKRVKNFNFVYAWVIFLKTHIGYYVLLSTKPGNSKGGSINVPLTSCLAGMEQSVLQIKIKIVSCHTADSKPAKQEVNGTVILPPLVFPDQTKPHALTITPVIMFVGLVPLFKSFRNRN